MITRVSSALPMVRFYANSSPSFGFAKLNDTGRSTADEFGYNRNQFVNGNLFKKQSIFSQSALTKELNDGASFIDICTNYGCTKNGKANAEFIKTQILSGKSFSAIDNLEESTKNQGLLALFQANFDNPELSRKDTDSLLTLVKDALDEKDYVKYAGIIKVGTEK